MAPNVHLALAVALGTPRWMRSTCIEISSYYAPTGSTFSTRRISIHVPIRRCGCVSDCLWKLCLLLRVSSISRTPRVPRVLFLTRRPSRTSGLVASTWRPKSRSASTFGEPRPTEPGLKDDPLWAKFPLGVEGSRGHDMLLLALFASRSTALLRVRRRAPTFTHGLQLLPKVDFNPTHRKWR